MQNVVGSDNPGMGPYTSPLRCVTVTKNPITPDGFGEVTVCFWIQYK